LTYLIFIGIFVKITYMSKKITFSSKQIDDIIKLYVEDRMGTPSIGGKYGVHKAVINRILKENGVILDQSGRRNTGGKSAADKRYRNKNIDKLKEYYKEWAEDNRTNLREYHTEWRDNNREKVREWARNYERKRRAEDPKYRLAARTRTAVYTCLKEASVVKYRSTFDILGYTIEELMQHLEKQFTERMTWENYGEWHVDHIRPMASFNFTSPEDEEFKACWSLDNLQPLWGPDNLSKGSKML
jgi:hypothetical protein